MRVCRSAVHATAQRQRGLTMIELMISITIGLFLVGAIGYLYISSRAAYRSNAAQSRIQEDARFGLDAIMHDARAVGDVGCNAAASVLPVAGVALSLPGDNGGPRAFSGPASALFGVDAPNYQFSLTPPSTPFAPPTAPSYFAGDVLQMVIPTSMPVPLVADADSTNFTVTLANNSAQLRPNDYLLVANCLNASVTRVSAAPVAGGPGGGSVVVGLVGQPLLPASIAPQMTLATHPSAQRVDAVTYYVGQYPGRPYPALYRFSATYSPATGVAEEIIDHVENMSVLYLIGSNPPQTAAQITAANAWGKVTSVRVSLQIVGDEQSTAGVQVPVSLVPGNAIPAPDTRLRQVFTATAALRNRLQ